MGGYYFLVSSWDLNDCLPYLKDLQPYWTVLSSSPGFYTLYVLQKQHHLDWGCLGDCIEASQAAAAAAEEDEMEEDVMVGLCHGMERVLGPHGRYAPVISFSKAAFCLFKHQDPP